ncbi:MAG: AsmA-like C-terminal region-containing protein [Caulobacterales bacterium]
MRKRVRFALLPLMEALALCLVLVFGGGAYLLWRIQQGPMSLQWARGYLERMLAADESGDTVAIGSLTARWSVPHNAIQVIATPVDSFTSKGALLARTNKLVIEFRPEQMLAGRSALSRFEADGGLFSVVLRSSGKLEAGIGAPDAVMKRDRRPDPERLSKIIKAIQAAWRGEGSAGGLDYISLENAKLIFYDERSLRTTTASNAFIKIRRYGPVVAGNLNLDLNRGAAKATADLQFRGSSPGPLDAQLKLSDFNPAVFVPPDIASFLQMVDAPVDVDARLRLKKDGGIAAIGLDATAGAGQLRREHDVRPLQSVQLKARFEPSSDTLLLTKLDLTAEGARLRASGHIQAPMLLFGRTSRYKSSAFSLHIPSVIWTTPVDTNWKTRKSGQIRNLEVAGRIFKSGDRIVLDRATGLVDRATLNLSGEVRRGALGKAKRAYSVEARGDLKGAVSVDAVLAFWPSSMAKGAREWLGEALEAGDILNTNFVADVSAPAIAESRIPDSALSLKFAFDRAAVRPYKNSFLIEDAKGSARLGGDSFKLNATGRSGTVRLEDGSVEIANLIGEDRSPVVVKVVGRGDVAGFARMFARDLDDAGAARLGGSGVVTFSLARPLRSDVPWNQYEISGQGSFTSVRVENVIASLPMENGRFDVSLNRDQLTASGVARIGGQPANVTWKELLQDDKGPTTHVAISALATASILDDFGVPSRAALRGSFGADISATGERLKIRKGLVNLNLAQMEIAPEGLKWRKSIGTPGQFSLAFARVAEDAPTAISITALANNAMIRGTAVLGDNTRMLSGDLVRFYIPGAFDITGKLRQTDDGGQMDIRGPLAEGRTVLGLIFSGGSDGEPAKSKPNLRISAAIDHVYAGQEPTLKSLTFAGDMERGHILRARMNAQTVHGKPINLTITPDPQAGDRKLRLDMDDLGAAARFVLKEGQVRNGVGVLDGRLVESEDGKEVADLNLQARDFELRGTPGLARLLTLGSFRGLADVLQGDGIKFSSLRAPLKVEDNHMQIKEARASGPAMGITVKGDLNFDNETMDVNGVLAPSYGINSVLGNVPLLGSVLVSRKGEGVFGMTYAMEGPFENARTSVNPLSVLTPGILRRVFEPGTPLAEKEQKSSVTN